MTLTPCPDLSAAAWINASDQPWYRLAAFGPSVFPAYARLRFLPDPAHDGQPESDVERADDAPSDIAQLRDVLQTLAPHTRTPDDCYVCLWDGWGWTIRGGDGAWTLAREDRPASDVPLLASPPACLGHAGCSGSVP